MASVVHTCGLRHRKPSGSHRTISWHTSTAESMLVNPEVLVYTQVSPRFHLIHFLDFNSFFLAVPTNKDLGINLLFQLGE